MLAVTVLAASAVSTGAHFLQSPVGRTGFNINPKTDDYKVRSVLTVQQIVRQTKIDRLESEALLNAPIPGGRHWLYYSALLRSSTSSLASEAFPMPLAIDSHSLAQHRAWRSFMYMSQVSIEVQPTTCETRVTWMQTREVNK